MMDSALFLVASFFATTSAIPVTKRWALTRALVYGFWIIAILPLSNYIRSELTSRLSIRSPPGSLDSIASEHDLKQNYTGHVLYSKLNSLFWKQQKKKASRRINDIECLHCAQRKDHICLIDHFSEWKVNMEAPTVVESVDTLKPIFGITPVRKNYPFLKAYADLLRRTFEASLRIVDKEDILNELRYGTPNASWASSQRSEQIEDFRIFFSCFLVILGVAVVVLVIEILIGRCMKYKK
ncbi:hypothetical protein V5799_023953, partial [Amblyomma americanum]